MAIPTLYTTRDGSGTRPTLVLMHFLGGSGREWDEVAALLGPEYPILRVDLPGFGGSADVPGYTVEEMADAVHATTVASGLKRYILVGHSMSGKVALVLARRAQDRRDQRLDGLVLVAPSPPSPEPIDDQKRTMMLGLLGTEPRTEDGRDDQTRARAYITKNELRDIPQNVERRATAEVLKMNPAAWTAWLTGGSKENWAAQVGILETPALIIAGEKDLSLGPKQQIDLTMPHLRFGELQTVPNCSHLIPMECPSIMAHHLREFVASVESRALVPAEYLDFIESNRLSPRTRQVLEQRMRTPPPASGVLNPRQMVTLRAMLARIVPQPDGPAIDLAGAVQDRLTHGKGDGWRYDVLPHDAQAYREGLDRLAADGFLSMTPEAQDECLRSLAAEPGTPAARWFEEVRGDAVVAYMAHPATLARIGYSGIGVGGADTEYKGYVTLGPNERDTWEPLALRPYNQEPEQTGFDAR